MVKNQKKISFNDKQNVKQSDSSCMSFNIFFPAGTYIRIQTRIQWFFFLK